MAEEDHLIGLFLDEDVRVVPATVSPDRRAEYRMTLKRLGVLGIARERGDLIWIPAIRHGYLVPDVTRIRSRTEGYRRRTREVVRRLFELA